ncbi:hypothetical protein Rhe02_82830 [Rhizocola hellebori]|uniref:Uncharacterized protein n=1 Tax=Rhizocola hellebori TaxID=1392758 RepID=A0A8J3QGL4_9ACTN|nr:hypothetical protein [Rhizocola hellebori]GIH10216.1 hypothetical protein Rhe02_82830 [Rhizocola hellebori]
MVKRIFAGRMLAGVTALMAAATLGAFGGVVASSVTPQAAHAGAPGGKITVDTVMERAEWWMATYGVVYSQEQSNAKADGAGEKYRPDCSGFVSMAWHLKKKSDGWDRYTGDLAGFGDTTWLSSLDLLKRGDAILGVSYGHVALFDKWADSSKTAMWIYDEYSTGSAGRYAKIDKSWYSSRSFRGLHYNNMVSDTWGAPTGLVCQYKVSAPSGKLNQRSGPGTNYTVEGYFVNGDYVWAAQDKTVVANGYTYRRFSGSRFSNFSYKLFVGSGDGATFARTSAACL